MLRLGRRSLAAVRYFSATAVAEASKVPAPSPAPGAITIATRKNTGTRKDTLVRELRKLKRYKHALEVCEWMTLQQDIKLVEGDYAVHLDLIAKVRGINSAEKFFEDLPDQMKG
ncbi:unnamed protein product [Lactuca virosa]|uniref:Uncharacterized protein n=1 Tax=Lactuca virosa TaxID=75947 RepID=A0AAU9PB48_9ASTR|nr:unnamed protein product [Lactuca virosa]